MKTPLLTLVLALMVAPAFAQSTTSEPNPMSAAAVAAPPSAEAMQKEMVQMMEMGKIGDNHKILAGLVGDWTYTVKMWMDPNGKPQESKGTATRKAILDGHYFLAEHSGKVQMPGADGKMADVDFKGMSIEGYDNAKQKFVSSWADNMDTMILNSEGTYDAGSKTFTYTSNSEMLPGKITKIREVVRIVDNDHHTFEWFEDRNGSEAKTMEIDYTRKK